LDNLLRSDCNSSVICAIFCSSVGSFGLREALSSRTVKERRRRVLIVFIVLGAF
jgi:hypothetical protein